MWGHNTRWIAGHAERANAVFSIGVAAGGRAWRHAPDRIVKVFKGMDAVKGGMHPVILTQILGGVLKFIQHEKWHQGLKKTAPPGGNDITSMPVVVPGGPFEALSLFLLTVDRNTALPGHLGG